MLKSLSKALVEMGQMIADSLNKYNENIDLYGGNSIEAKASFMKAQTIADCLKALGFNAYVSRCKRYYTDIVITDQDGGKLGIPWKLEYEESLKNYSPFESYADIKAEQEEEEFYTALANNSYSKGDI